MTNAQNSSPRLEVTSITGHAGDEGAVDRGYQGELSLQNKLAMLEAILSASDGDLARLVGIDPTTLGALQRVQ